MKKITARLVLLTSIVLMTTPLAAELVTLDGGAVRFEAPDGFKPVPQEIIDLKYPSSRAPKYVIGNESAATTIAYDLKPHDVPQERIDQARESFAAAFPRMIPGLEWKENKTITLAGQKWGYLEMTTTAVDTNIHNIMLFTGHNGQMLVFNFNSTKEEFPKYEQALRKAVETIQIK